MPDHARGLVFRLDFDDVLQGPVRAGEASGPRFAVVVSVRSLNRLLDTVVVAPTSASGLQEKRNHFHNVFLEEGTTATGIAEDCVVQLHLLYSLNGERLGKSVGEVDESVLDEIEMVLANGVLGEAT